MRALCMTMKRIENQTKLCSMCVYVRFFLSFFRLVFLSSVRESCCLDSDSLFSVSKCDGWKHLEQNLCVRLYVCVTVKAFKNCWTLFCRSLVWFFFLRFEKQAKFVFRETCIVISFWPATSNGNVSCDAKRNFAEIQT